MSLRWKALAAMALACGAGPGLSAQTKAPDKPSFTVLMTARDKSGRLIDNLAAGEVTALIDDKPSTPSRFARAADAPLSLGLVVDTGFAQRRQIDAERDALKNFLAALVFGRDKGFVLHYDRRVELLQDLTSQRGRLERALEKLNASEIDLNDDEGARRRNDDEDDNRGGRAGMQRERLRQLRSALSDAVYLSSTELLRRPAGRKVIVVFSGGVNGGGKSTIVEALEQAQRSDVVVYTIYDPGKFELPPELSGGDRSGGVGRSGGGWPGGGGGWPGGSRRGRQAGPEIKPEELRNQGKRELEQLSRQSGGRLFEISKKFTLSDALRQIREELEGGYFLEFKDSGSARGDYRSFKLEVSRKDANVQCRKEFYAQ